MAIENLRIFVTVPYDLEDEGAEIGAYIVELGRIYALRGINIDVILLEEEDPDSGIGIVDAIESDYYYTLLYCHNYDAAIDCFEEALKSFRHDGHPRLFTYFKDVASSPDIEEGVISFMRALERELGHFYSRFSSIDTVKLDIILEISRDVASSESLNTHDGTLLMDGKEVLNLSGLPAYARNDRLIELRKRKAMLDSKLDPSKRSADDDVISEDPSQLSMLVAEQRRIGDQIDQIEGDILQVAIRLMAYSSSQSTLSLRIQQARELFRQGNLAEARKVLEDEEIDRERRNRRREMDAHRARLELLRQEEQEFVECRLIDINLIRATGLSAANDERILSNYAECLDSTLHYNLDPEFLSEYIYYLHDNKHFDVFDDVADIVLRYTKSKYLYDPEHYAHAYVATASQVGFGYIQRAFEASSGAIIAEPILMDALPVAQKRAETLKTPEAKKDYADLLNHLGISLVDRLEFERAYDYLRKSVELGQEIVEVDRDHRRSLAVTYNFLTLCFYRNHNCTDEAIGYAKQSVDLRRELYEEDPDEYELFYARSVYVLGAVYRRAGYNEQAEAAFIEALDLLRKIAVISPDGGWSNLSSAEGGYSKLLIKNGRYEEALPILEDARAIRERLYEKTPDTFGRPLLFILRKLKRVYEELGLDKEAIEAREEIAVLEIATTNQSDLPDSD